MIGAVGYPVAAGDGGVGRGAAGLVKPGCSGGTAVAAQPRLCIQAGHHGAFIRIEADRAAQGAEAPYHDQHRGVGQHHNVPKSPVVVKRSYHPRGRDCVHEAVAQYAIFGDVQGAQRVVGHAAGLEQLGFCGRKGVGVVARGAGGADEDCERPGAGATCVHGLVFLAAVVLGQQCNQEQYC